MVQVLQYLLDDVSDFLKTHMNPVKGENECKAEGQGCANILKAFINHISERESENFRTRRHDNKDSVTVTTIHQVLNSLAMCYSTLLPGTSLQCPYFVKIN